MNKQDYEKIKYESWIEFCKEHPIETPSMSIGEAFAYAFDRAYALGKKEKDAEGEEMLCSPKNLAFKLYDIANGSYRENGKEWFHGYMKAMVDLFGNIFPPVAIAKESKDPKPAEPSSQNSPENCGNADLISTDCDKQFDTTIKDSFCNERRLNIATQIMSSILSNQMMLNNLAHGETTGEGVVKSIVNTTMMYTDALLAEWNSPKN